MERARERERKQGTSISFTCERGYILVDSLFNVGGREGGGGGEMERERGRKQKERWGERE